MHGLGAGSYQPSYAGFVALVGVLLFNYVGFELPSSAGEEMTNPAVWKLRRSYPMVERPYRMPFMRTLTVVLLALIVIAIIQRLRGRDGVAPLSSPPR